MSGGKGPRREREAGRACIQEGSRREAWAWGHMEAPGRLGVWTGKVVPIEVKTPSDSREASGEEQVRAALRDASA